MAKRKLIQGEEVILSFWDDDAEAYMPVVCMEDHTYTVNTTTSEGDPNKCEPNPPQKIDGVSYELSGNGLIVDHDDPNFDNQVTVDFIEDKIWGKEEIIWKMEGANETKYGVGLFTGKTENYPVGDSTFDFTATGNEKPTSTDPNDND